MGNKRHKPEEIVTKLRQVEVIVGQGMARVDAIREVRIVRDWFTSIGLETSAYGTHSMRRTKVTQIYKKTGNLRAVRRRRHPD